MNWTDLKNKIYFNDGGLREIVAFDTLKSDWLKLLNELQIKYPISHKFHDLNIKTDKFQFELIEDFWNGKIDATSTLSIYIEKDILINTHFFEISEIEFDFNPIDIISEEEHKILINFIVFLEKILDKKFYIFAENNREVNLL